MRIFRGEEGLAILAAVLASMLLLALGGSLVLLTITETGTAASFVRSSEAVYAADAIAERALPELAQIQDWTAILDGTRRSALADGSPDGTRTLADGSRVTLEEVVNLADCGQTTPCTGAQMDAVTVERPWGPNNPRWQLYAYCPLQSLLPAGAAPSPFYVILLAGDDGMETDGDPRVDGGPPAGGEASNPGSGGLLLRAEAFGPGGAHGAVELAIRRSVRVLSWREAAAPPR
ncbi:MAG TPA: hypothetical protein VH417_15510 [Vicinamibacterales bacterium]